MAADNFRSFAIFGAMRSGSNLLERYINQFDGLKCHGELFNPAFIGWSGQESYLGVDKAARDAVPGQLVDAILANDAENIPGFRIFRDHNENAIEQFLQDKSCAKIILSRDPIDSFTSLKIARKTDQWLIHDELHRKTAQIYFDISEFEEYRKIRQAYSDKIIAILKASGQEFFNIHFDQLNDAGKINELAAFLGAKTPIQDLKEIIKRQNPGALNDKIVNYAEVFEQLGLPEPEVLRPGLPVFASEKGTDLSRAYFLSEKNVIFAPIPSAPDGRIRQWLSEVDGAAPVNNFGMDAYKNWQNEHNNPIIFAVLRHPVKRAYDVFMRKIFLKNAGGFAKIREALEVKFGVFLPDLDTSLEDLGYDKSAHRAAFSQFLLFIHHNLNEQTDIRTDGRWRSQSDLIAAYEKLFGECEAIKETDLDFATGYFANRLALNKMPNAIPAQKNQWLFELADIYSPEIEKLTRIAYAQDYDRFKFQNWR